MLNYPDPYVPIFPRMRRHRYEFDSIRFTAETIAAQDAVVIATNHAAFDDDLIRKRAKLIVDTGFIRPEDWRGA